jgi:hypothetical protein
MADPARYPHNSAEECIAAGCGTCASNDPVAADPGAATPADVEALIVSLRAWAEGNQNTSPDDLLLMAAAALARVEQERDEARKGWERETEHYCEAAAGEERERAACERAEVLLKRADEHEFGQPWETARTDAHSLVKQARAALAASDKEAGAAE